MKRFLISLAVSWCIAALPLGYILGKHFADKWWLRHLPGMEKPFVCVGYTDPQGGESQCYVYSDIQAAVDAMRRLPPGANGARLYVSTPSNSTKP